MNSCHSKWVETGTTSESIYFYDSDSVTRDNNLLSAWTMIDYLNEQQNLSGQKYLSVISERKYDCRNKKYSVISYLQYEGHFGTGKNISKGKISKNEYQWSKIKNKSMIAKEWLIICNKNNSKN